MTLNRPLATLAVFTLAPTILLAACGGDGSSRPAVTVRDSTSVLVTTNHRAPEELPEWRIEPEPLLDLGVVEGNEAYQFFRVMDAARLPDGRLVVVNAGTQQLRFYDAEGAFLESTGRAGEGPGEYRFPFRVLLLPGDSLLVYDLGLARFTVLDSALTVARTFRPQRALLNEPEIAGLIGDSLIVLHETLYNIPAAGFDTMYARVAFIGLEGEGEDSMMVASRLMGRIGEGGHQMVSGPHFDPDAQFAAGDEGLWVGSGRLPEVRLHGADGRVRRIVRWAAEPRAVTEADVTRRIEGMVEGATPETAARVRSTYSRVPAAEVFPVYDRLVIDAGDRLWARTPPRPGDEGPLAWTVFEPDGGLLARISLPAELRVHEIGEYYVLGTLRHEMDVEHVVVFDLKR